MQTQLIHVYKLIICTTAEELLYLGEEHELGELPGDDECRGEGGNGRLVQQARNRLSQGDTHCQNLPAGKGQSQRGETTKRRKGNSYLTASKMKLRETKSTFRISLANGKQKI